MEPRKAFNVIKLYKVTLSLAIFHCFLHEDIFVWSNLYPVLQVDRCLRKQDDFLHRKLSESGSPGRLDASHQDVSIQVSVVAVKKIFTVRFYFYIIIMLSLVISLDI